MASPTDVSGLKVWLDANALTGLSDGDPVGSFTDQSGAGIHSEQATAGKKPLYKTNIIGGKPALLYDGTDDFTKQASAYTDLPSTTIFVVLQPVTTTGLPDFVDGFASGKRHQIGIRSAKLQIFQGSTVTGTSNAAAATNYVLTGAFTSGASAMYVNGTSAGTSATAANVQNGLVIGANSGATAEFANAYIAEVICYSRVLTAGERATVHTYVQDKYGITVSDYIASAAFAAFGMPL